MTAVEASALLLHIGLPLALVARVGVVRKRPLASWVLDLSLAATYLAAMALATPLLAVPWYWPWLGAGLLVVAAAVGARRVVSSRGPRSPGWLRGVGFLFRGVLALVLAGLVVYGLLGRRPFEESAMDLAFPLRDGTYLVANGGSNGLVNNHMKTLTAPRFRAYRGQSFAVDLVKVGRWGSRTSGIFPDDPTAYAIFGDTLHAPCAGTVIRAVDEHPDTLPPGREPATLEGNHVILSCGGTWVLLAHMKRGSVRVVEGESMEVGAPLGRVGDSGRSDEPHLHIHAQTPGSDVAPLGGDPIPVSFDGRSLVRNDRVRGSGERHVTGSTGPPAAAGEATLELSNRDRRRR